MSSKDRSMRLARMWNSRSPGVETAWRDPDRISRNGCNSAGRGAPNRRSHASDPNPSTQESPASISRNSTARKRAERSAQKDRTVARFSAPGFTVSTRNIAARDSAAAIGCAKARSPSAASLPLLGLDSIGSHPDGSAACRLLRLRSPQLQLFGRQAYHRPPTNVHTAPARASLPHVAPAPRRVGRHGKYDCRPSARRFTAITVFPPTYLYDMITGSAWSAAPLVADGSLGAFAFSSLLRRVSPLIRSAWRFRGLLHDIQSGPDSAREFRGARCYHVSQNISIIRAIPLLCGSDTALFRK